MIPRSACSGGLSGRIAIMLVVRYSVLLILLVYALPLTGQEIRFIDLSSTEQRTQLRHPPAPASQCNPEAHCVGEVVGATSVGDGAPDWRDPRSLGGYVLGVAPYIDPKKPFESEFKVLNTGRVPIELPVSPHLSDLQPSDESSTFSYLSLALVVRVEGDTQGDHVLCIGFVELFGSPQREGSLLALRPAEWIRVKANVKLTTCSLEAGPAQLRGEFWLRRNTFRPQPGGALNEVQNLYPNATPTPPIAIHLLREPDRGQTKQ